MLGVAITFAMPYAVLGAVEAYGAAITEIAVLGFSAEALAGAGAGAAIGLGLVGTTAALVPGSPNGKAMPTNTAMSEDYLVTAQRPISGWRTWVKAAPAPVSPSLSPTR
jgi:hypothetical protein